MVKFAERRSTGGRADEFVIHTVKQRSKYTVDGGFIRLAQIMERDDGYQDFEVVATLMGLFSEKQPDVVNLTCASWGIPQQLAYLTIRDIREALGDIFDLRLVN